MCPPAMATPASTSVCLMQQCIPESNNCNGGTDPGSCPSGMKCVYGTCVTEATGCAGCTDVCFTGCAPRDPMACMGGCPPAAGGAATDTACIPTCVGKNPGKGPSPPGPPGTPSGPRMRCQVNATALLPTATICEDANEMACKQIFNATPPTGMVRDPKCDLDPGDSSVYRFTLRCVLLVYACLLSAGNTKLRITVMLTARSDGKREKPFVLLPFGPNARCKKAVDKNFGNKLYLIWMETTWMNNPITAIYLKKVFGGLLQSVPWVLDAWDAVKEDVIIQSFKACGISAELDGSEDALINCLKEGNAMPNGVSSLVQARHEANAQALEEIMYGLELEAPEDPEDDAADNASDVSVISGGEENADESVDKAEVEEIDTDS
ncbi:pogo transposable element with KRAB domain-like protein [Aphelenchoides avenae]|nr:pogo transposable element with KRAB domain-like protein [Aphelenchus avenae]